MNPQELLFVLTALVRRRLEDAPDSQPSSLRLASERLAQARAQALETDPLAHLEALRSAPRHSRPSAA